DALQEIAKELGKNDWNFSVDPCSNHPSWFSQSRQGMPTYVNQINCTCSAGDHCPIPYAMALLTVSYSQKYPKILPSYVSLKGQDLSGVLPKSLMKLPYLKVIDLSRNYLNGTIPREWASIKLEYLSVFVNRLSGPIPAYLGNIKTLTYLSLENNQFSGTVPPELGKLVNLQNLTLNVNYLTGQLPIELTNLTKLGDLRLSSNNFSGKMPDYFLSWKNLQKLEMVGTGFEGPIPSGISALTNLVELRISDLNGEGSTFPLLAGMRKMSKLMLRNCNISGHIPPSIADYFPVLKILDLSFNKLEGPIPDGLQNLKKLENLYLTSNFLSGDIPDWIKTRGVNTFIDLSYNNFNSSSVPKSCKGGSVNFFRTSSRNSSSPLECQESFPCSKVRYSLYINCGGNKTEIGKVVYDEDDEPGGAAKYVPARPEWGFSSSGHFWNLDSSASGNDYIARNDSTLGMTDSALYSQARLSASSLTYYGRCLGFGNYTVTLDFAELLFSDNNSFRSLGVRIFDVYIQEKLVLKDFDVRKEANGSDKALTKTFTSIPVNDTIQIRFYYAGKGSTGVPVRGMYGPLVSAISVVSEFKPPVDWKRIAAIAVGVVASFLAIVFVALVIIWRKRHSDYIVSREKVLKGFDLKNGSFTFIQLKAATDNFDPANKIGEGGFGSVFKGTLLDGHHIAVKHLFSRSSQANRQFVNEIGIISGLNHPNLVRFYGCCAEGSDLLLVYEYMVNNHLGHALFGPDDGLVKLDWATRRKIAIGIARGLAFLHEESPIKIVHRDIKVANILLDGELNAKISDFGLARLDEDKTHISTRIAGTIGYMAPEYVLWGYLTFKADVYSFGVVALEIVAGRCNMNFRPDENHFCLLDWAMWLRQKGDLMHLVDPRLGADYNKEEALRMIKIALLCTDPSPALRPSMSTVVMMLEGDVAVQESTKEDSTALSNSEWMLKTSRRQQHDQVDIETTSETRSLLYPEESTPGSDLYPARSL
ncbi:hypothetical protein Dimus_021948, partial [Dionaea muscipula]